MRYFLSILIIASVIAGAISAYQFGERQHLFEVIFLPLVFIINGLCAFYLYRKATSKKIEWGLFGLLGNVSAIFVFWLINSVREKWSKGERFFG